MARARKIAAAGVAGTLMPVIIGERLDPIEDRLWVAWVRGAGVLGVAAALAWAVDELGRADGSGESGRQAG